MNLAWVEAEIEKTIDGPNTPQNVFDLAALCVVRAELAKRAAPQSAGPPADEKHREAVILTTHSADLDKVPTLQQIDDALGAYTVQNAEERERVKEIRTWRNIIEGK